MTEAVNPKKSSMSALLGGIAWVGILAGSSRGGVPIGTIEQLFLLAPLVVVPLGLVLAAMPQRLGEDPLPYRAACFLQPIAAAGAVASFWFEPGIPAAVLAFGWFLVCGLVGFSGLIRLLQGKRFHAEELCFDVGLSYLPIGGAWLFLSRLGATMLGVEEPIKLLTAVHFHFTGFAVPLIAGATGRFLAKASPLTRRLFRFVAAGVIGGTPLIAAGFVFSPILKVVSVVFLATSLMALSGLMVFAVLPRVRHPIAKSLLVLSAASLVAGMALADAYAIGEFTGKFWISIPQMARTHGLINGLGFTLCGLMAWSLIQGEAPCCQH